MKFMIPAIAALAASYPAPAQAWNSMGPSFFSSPLVVTSPSSILRRQQALVDRAFQRPSSSPRYEITDNEEKFQLAVDVPGVKMEDIHVSLEDNVLSVTGHRESSDSNNYRFTSKFSQSFSLDPSVEVDKLSASLENGVLVVAAPKDMSKIEANIRRIPISAAHPKSEHDEGNPEKIALDQEETNKVPEDATDVEIENMDA